MAAKKKTVKKKTAKKVVAKAATKKAVTRKKVTAKKKTQRKKTTNTVTQDILKKNGRPTLYRPEFCQEIIEYFDIEPYVEVDKVHPKSGLPYTCERANRPPTFGGYARKIGVARETLWHWSKAHPEFNYAMQRARAIVEDILVVNALMGLYDGNYAKFIAKNYTSLRDINETRDVTDDTPPETPAEIEEKIATLGKKIERLKAQI